jgi:multidrug efflux system membrane fusion protein
MILTGQSIKGKDSFIVDCITKHERCIVRAALTVSVLLSMIWMVGCNRSQPKLAPTKPPEVDVDQPTIESVIDFEEFTGRTDAVPSVEIRARVSGYLDEVFFKDGADVTKGEPLFKIDDRIYKATLDREDGSVKQAKAKFDHAVADYNRMLGTAPGSLAPQERDKTTYDRHESEAAYIAAQASRKLAEINYNFTRIAAPISGRISRRLVDPGNLVKADETPLTTIVSLDPIYAYFDIDERTLLKFRRLLQEGKIKSARETDVTVDVGVADEEGYSLTGVINFIENRVESGTGTLRIRAEIKNAKRFLSPGMFVRIRLPVGVPHQATVVAEVALSTDQGQKFVYVVNEKDEVIYRPVKAGTLNQGKRVIEDGLQPSDRVIVSGQQRVRAGVKVTPKKAEPVPKPAAPPEVKTSAGL